MKYATLMRYGGELGEASDCDYDDFRKLIPLCPNCKEPVFLRKASDRRLKSGKVVKVPAMWCHFAAISQEQAAECESRVNGYSETEKKKILAKARGQRLKLIQRWCWNLLKKYYLDKTIPNSDFAIDEARIVLTCQDLCRSWHSELWDFLQEAPYRITLGYVERIYSLHYNGGISEELTDKFRSFMPWLEYEGIDRRMQAKVVAEVYAYLQGHRNEYIFAMLILATGVPDPETVSVLEGGDQHDLCRATLARVLAGLSSVPWQDEFDKIDSISSGSPTPSATHS